MSSDQFHLLEVDCNFSYRMRTASMSSDQFHLLEVDCNLIVEFFFRMQTAPMSSDQFHLLEVDCNLESCFADLRTKRFS
jgi:hypothetical protein